jgi:hypothetical protein
VKVLLDAIHADLLHSLRMLFEDRFGWEMYVPHGMGWYDEGIWRFEADRLGDQVARQFLQPWDTDRNAGDHWQRDDATHPGRITKRVTLEQARDLKPDIVIATLAENEPGLYRFSRDVGAVYGIQIGNQGAPNGFGVAAFVMSSVTLPHVKPWMPHVFYHQEFDLNDFRFEWPPSEPDLVMTRVQCFNQTPDYERFQRFAEATPELRWRHYGHCGDRDALWGGDAPSTAVVAAQMRSARIGYHVKRWSDGYGHVGFNWFAVGRPVIGSAGYYLGRQDGVEKLMAPLWVEGETSFDVDTKTQAEVVDLVRRLATDDDYHRQISEQATARFHEVVSFDAEAEQIRAMLEAVLSDRRVAA